MRAYEFTAWQIQVYTVKRLTNWDYDLPKAVAYQKMSKQKIAK